MFDFYYIVKRTNLNLDKRKKSNAKNRPKVTLTDITYLWRIR